MGLCSNNSLLLFVSEVSPSAVSAAVKPGNGQKESAPRKTPMEKVQHPTVFVFEKFLAVIFWHRDNTCCKITESPCFASLYRCKSD